MPGCACAPSSLQHSCCAPPASPLPPARSACPPPARSRKASQASGTSERQPAGSSRQVHAGSSRAGMVTAGKAGAAPPPPSQQLSAPAPQCKHTRVASAPSHQHCPPHGAHLLIGLLRDLHGARLLVAAHHHPHSLVGAVAVKLGAAGRARWGRGWMGRPAGRMAYYSCRPRPASGARCRKALLQADAGAPAHTPAMAVAPSTPRPALRKAFRCQLPATQQLHSRRSAASARLPTPGPLTLPAPPAPWPPPPAPRPAPSSGCPSGCPCCQRGCRRRPAGRERGEQGGL